MHRTVEGIGNIRARAANGNTTVGVLNSAGQEKGLIWLSHNGTFNVKMQGDGDIFAKSYGDISDLRLKEEIRMLDNPIATLKGIRGVSYRMKGDPGDARTIGVVAQEVQKVLPCAVMRPDTAESPDMPSDIANGKRAVKGKAEGDLQDARSDYLYVNYRGLTALLIEAVKDQEERIRTLEKQLATKTGTRAN